VSPRIVGPGGPHDKGGVVVDTRDAILLDEQMVATADSSEASIIAIELMGRVNRSERRDSRLFLMNGDGAAAIVSEIVGLMSRCSRSEDKRLVDLSADFMVAMEERTREMP
jgi:hypothetical protein